MSAFDEVRTSNGKRQRVCPRCKKADTAGNVTLRLLKAARKGVPQEDISSLTGTFCETCAVEVFSEMRDTLAKAKVTA